MGRKIDMKKIEDVTKCQVTFSKRRSSLMKKANEIAVCCDVDVAFVAFSPSGRVSKFCNQKKIEEVLHRYVNLPADKRFHHMNNVQGKMEKLKQLSHINGETSKLHYLDKQIENLELQIKKRGLELQILETDLRDFEIGAGQEPSLHQLSWCERNLNQSLQKVIARKMQQVELEKQSEQQISASFNQNEMIQNSISGQILMQLDPWISPYSAKVRESIFQDLVDQTNQSVNANANVYTLNQPIPSNIPNAPIQESPQPYIPAEQRLMMDQRQPAVFNFQDQNNVNALKQSSVMDQPLFNFYDQNNVSANNNASSVLYSDAIHMSTQTLCTIQDPSGSRPAAIMSATNPSTSKMPQSLYGGMGSGLQCMNSNLMSQFTHIEGSQETGNVNMGGNTVFFNGNNTRDDNVEDFPAIDVDQTHRNDNIEEFQPINVVEQTPRNDNIEEFCAINVDQTPINYQQQVPYDDVQHHRETSQEAQFDNLLLEENQQEDNAIWGLSRQKSGSLWEWDDLLLDENFNFQNLP